MFVKFAIALKDAVPAKVTALLAARAFVAPNFNRPAPLIVVPPVYVFCPVNVKCADPVFVNVPAPLITPAKVELPASPA